MVTCQGFRANPDPPSDACTHFALVGDHPFDLDPGYASCMYSGIFERIWRDLLLRSNIRVVRKKRRRSDEARSSRAGRRIRIPLAPAGERMVNYPFQLKQTANVGTTNPVVSRLQMQMFPLVDALGLAKPERDAILEHAFVGSQWFVRAEQNKDEYLRLSGKFIARAAQGHGVLVQGAALVVLEPLNLGDHYQLFLIDLTIGLRLFFKASGMVLVGQPTGWHELKTAIEERFPRDHPLRILIDRHERWSKTLYDDRGDVEHDPYIFPGFRVGTDKHGNPLLFRPMGVDDRPLETTMETYFQDGFTFAEELLVLSIQSRLSAGRLLVEIPELERDSAAPVRFKIN
jgi:hypothetical protein